MVDGRRVASVIPTEPIAGRFRVEEIIGRGGMAAVYRVFDISTEKRLALKRMELVGEEKKRDQVARLFEREYHTLSQLAHPRVVEAFDYGVDSGASPYYTMELLDGGDLRELAPVPWRQACRFLRDICSCLSLIHSRRMVHRDLNPRNIRCTRDGKAKLIDFGALAPMGPSKQIVGTPPFTAPEVVNSQSLDARTDLFSLGATAYYALVGHHVYTARRFLDLEEVWRNPPAPPSSMVADIPRELDNLVLSLVNLDPMARPANAAEVLDRLNAVAGLESDEQLPVSRSYLSTPTLVGRGEQTRRVRRMMAKTVAGRGNSLLIQGTSGVGRSRFLDACVLAGKLNAAVVVRADAEDSQAGAWGALRSLVRQLMDALPELASDTVRARLPVLGHVIPELLDRVESVPLERFDESNMLRPRVQRALCEWFGEIAAQRFLVVAVDDVHRLDEPSAAFVALLCKETPDRSLMVLVTAETEPEASPSAVIKLIRDSGGSIKLRPLTPEDSEQLVRSVFGDSPSVGLLAARLHAISDGSPRLLMQLAQHLVDRNVARFSAGAWTLPGDLRAIDLPETVAQARKAQVDSLSESSRELGRILALCDDLSFTFDECLQLFGSENKSELIAGLDELVAKGIVRTDGHHYAMRQRGWVSPLMSNLGEAQQRGYHARLAEVLMRRESEGLRVGRHLLQAGQIERAVDELVAYSDVSQQQTRADSQVFLELLRSLPEGWLDVFRVAIRFCETHERPKRDRFLLLSRLSGIVAVTGIDDVIPLQDLLHQLYLDSGLDLYPQLDASLDPGTRLGQALQKAQERYDASPEAEQVLPPLDAIRQLARALVQAVGFLAMSYDLAFWESLPSLEPYVPLSPALGVVQNLVRTIGYRITARCEATCDGYREILDRTAQPDRAGMEDTYHRYMRSGVSRGLGMMEAAMGLASSLQAASDIESDPTHEINAWRIRMLYHLWQGATEEAERCEKKVELLQIQNSPIQWFEGSQLWREVPAYAQADDLTRTRQTIDNVERMANQYPAFVPTLHYARGEYQRIRGDHENALKAFETAVDQASPGRSPSWADAAGALIKALCATDRVGEARRRGREFLQAAEAAELGYLCEYIRIPLAVAEARLGDLDKAVEEADVAIANLTRLGVTGLTLGLAYEARARVAVLARDEEAFVASAERCAEQYLPGRNPALTAKYKALIEEARRQRLGVSRELAGAAGSVEQVDTAITTLTTALSDCQGAEERSRRALELLLSKSGAAGGYLYTMQSEGPELSAQSGETLPTLELEHLVRDFLSREIEATDVTATGAPSDIGPLAAIRWSLDHGKQFRPLLLSHYANNGFVVTGLAVVNVSSEGAVIFPGKLLAAISRSLFEAGDVATVYASR